MPKIRRPTQAGVFYEGGAEALRSQVEGCFLHQFGPKKLPYVNRNGPRKIVGLISPHAGYMYSGPVAANAYFELASDGAPDVVVILGPNHTSYGSALAVMTEGLWQTPMGNVKIDTEVAHAIAREAPILDIDEAAHRFEHSIEVQLPFLQYLYGSEFRFVPICFGMQDLASSLEIGCALAKVLATKNAVVIASSDMTHYESQKTVYSKDLLTLEAVQKLDENKFFSIIEKQNVSACGPGPIVATITFAKGVGAKEAKLLSYKSSGDIIGDYSSVVGYAAVCFKK